MKSADGFYWIPLMPKNLADATKGVPRVNWPKEVETEYRRLHGEFTASKAEFLSWVRKDRDSRMKANAKLILIFLVECLNFETGRCDPSHETIADELEISIRTVERLVPEIALAKWMTVTRRGKTTTNFYRFRVPIEKVHLLLDRVDDLRQRRADAREQRRLKASDPTGLAAHPISDPPFERSDDPTGLADKPLKGTSEKEPVNQVEGAEGVGYPLRAGAHEADQANSYAMVKGRAA